MSDNLDNMIFIKNKSIQNPQYVLIDDFGAVLCEGSYKECYMNMIHRKKENTEYNNVLGGYEIVKFKEYYKDLYEWGILE